MVAMVPRHAWTSRESDTGGLHFPSGRELTRLRKRRRSDRSVERLDGGTARAARPLYLASDGPSAAHPTRSDRAVCDTASNSILLARPADGLLPPARLRD